MNNDLYAAEKDIILIVDDKAANLGVLSDFLDEEGFEVRVARDGESALEKANYEPPDMILLDVMMPGIDGFETCCRLKGNSTTAEIPIIFMTALSDVVDKVKGLSLGAVDYITKPFQPDEVLARIKLHLKLQKLNQKIYQQNLQLKQEIEERYEAQMALQKLTQELEERVNERTHKLSDALHILQETQLQLVQTEKLATLGQLVAGVAHEINNPLSSISGNLACAEGFMENIIEHLRLYQENYPTPAPQIQEHAEEIEVDYLLEDLPKIIASMKVGTERIQALSLSLRNFYRSDSSKKEPVNLREGIDSTLLILQHRLKGKGNRPVIEVIKKYGDLPLVTCYPGQINQVFMNLIANAIDAIEEAGTRGYLASPKQPGKIEIHTQSLDSQSVIIRVKDNGAGMAEEVKNKIFEPMFTTKPIGRGTGLGLSISRSIIEEKHGGKLICDSEITQGSEFIIHLPIKPVE
ncbi:response regulator [Ancylothrix sp. C2]|uniref:hybrid sensor histidine kinase/response regulator n=1 Tax=Ancylothrix sp. D3o TaxID=2953691 RepID=UPI0021BB0E5D|nr:response regulator [Ancylothrix sp. D3o]MCT7949410.1 response regulator [Ancylothrix sp. D3o]